MVYGVIDKDSCRYTHIVMLSFRHLRDQFLHHDVHHGPGSEGYQVGQHQDDSAGRRNGKQSRDRLHDTG